MTPRRPTGCNTRAGSVMLARRFKRESFDAQVREIDREVAERIVARAVCRAALRRAV